MLVLIVVTAICDRSLAHSEVISTTAEVLAFSKSEYAIVVFKRNHPVISGDVHHDNVGAHVSNVSDSELTKRRVSNSTGLTVSVDNNGKGVILAIPRSLLTIPSTYKVLRSKILRSGFGSRLAIIRLASRCALSHSELRTIGEVLTLCESEHTVVVLNREHKGSGGIKLHHNNISAHECDVSDCELAKAGVDNSTTLSTFVNDNSEGVITCIIAAPRSSSFATGPSTYKVLSSKICGSLGSFIAIIVAVVIIVSLNACNLEHLEILSTLG